MFRLRPLPAGNLISAYFLRQASSHPIIFKDLLCNDTRLCREVNIVLCGEVAEKTQFFFCNTCNLKCPIFDIDCADKYNLLTLMLFINL